MKALPVERLFTTPQVAELEGISAKQLRRLVAVGKFPRPDQPSTKGGERSRWLESTIRRHREQRLAPAATVTP